MTETEQHHCITFLNIIMMSETLMEALEAIKETHLYRHELKSKVNLLMPELEKIIEKDLAKVWGVDDNAMYHLMCQQKELIHRISTVRPETWNMLNELLDMYEKGPDEFLKRNELVIN
jgi:hypothetical protein